MPERTKADVIRSYLDRFPDMRPSELARKITEENQDLRPTSPQEVSTLRKRYRRKPNNIPKAELVEAMECLLKAKKILGKEHCKKILDLLQACIWSGFTFASLLSHYSALSLNFALTA